MKAEAQLLWVSCPVMLDLLNVFGGRGRSEIDSAGKWSQWISQNIVLIKKTPAYALARTERYWI
jgi:hypothetical protein